MAVSVFPDEISTRPAELDGAGLSQAHPLQPARKGGHFAAWEQPQLFIDELRAAFRSLRLDVASRTSDMPL